MKGKIFYGWYVVAISLIVMTAAYSVYFAWPVFFPHFLEEFGWSRAATSMVFSVASAVYAIASLVSGILFDRFGPRRLFIISSLVLSTGAAGLYFANSIGHFYLFYSVLIAFGACSAGFIPNLAMVSNWFERKRATAVGISQMGTRDSFLLSPVTAWLIAILGWRSTWVVLAVASAVVIIPLSFFLRGKPQEMGLLPDGDTEVVEAKDAVPVVDRRIVDRTWAETDWTLVKAMKTFRFWAFTFVFLGVGVSLTALINHLMAMVGDFGVSSVTAATLLTVYAVTSMAGRLFGFISDRIGRELTSGICSGLMGLSLIVPLLISDPSLFWTYYIFIGLFGLSSGLLTPTFTAAAADIFQGKSFGAIIGAANMGYAIGASIFTWVFGFIFDVMGNYTLAVVITMLAVAMTALSIWLAAPHKVRLVAGKIPGA